MIQEERQEKGAGIPEKDDKLEAVVIVEAGEMTVPWGNWCGDLWWFWMPDVRCLPIFVLFRANLKIEGITALTGESVPVSKQYLCCHIGGSGRGQEEYGVRLPYVTNGGAAES